MMAMATFVGVVVGLALGWWANPSLQDRAALEAKYRDNVARLRKGGGS